MLLCYLNFSFALTQNCTPASPFLSTTAPLRTSSNLPQSLLVIKMFLNKYVFILWLLLKWVNDFYITFYITTTAVHSSFMYLLSEKSHHISMDTNILVSNISKKQLSSYFFFASETRKPRGRLWSSVVRVLTNTARPQKIAFDWVIWV